jgi:hypothetical protein
MTTRYSYTNRYDPHTLETTGAEYDEEMASMKMLVFFVVTPMFLIGLGIIAWALWSIVR